MKRTALRRRRKAAVGNAAQRERFHLETMQRAGWHCAVRDDGAHDGPRQAHHVTPQQAIKRWARTNRVDGKTLAEVLWDPANGMCVCRRHHDRHTVKTRKLPIAAVTDGARLFAEALHLDYLLELNYREETDDGAA